MTNPYPGGYPQQPGEPNPYGQQPPQPPQSGPPAPYGQQPGQYPPQGQPDPYNQPDPYTQQDQYPPQDPFAQPGQYQPGYAHPSTPQSPAGYQYGGPGGPPPPPPGSFLPGTPVPPSSGMGTGAKLALIIGGVVLLVAVSVGVWLVVGGKEKPNVDAGNDPTASSSPEETTGETEDTEVAEIGDCTTQSSDPDAIMVVDCTSPDAYFEVVARQDDPAETDETALANAVCTGTPATDYLVQTQGTSFLWIICMDALEIDTANWGAIPGQVGECLSDNQDYFQLVDCGDSTAYEEILVSEDNPDQSLTDAEAASAEICADSDATTYYSNTTDGPFEWFLCTKTL